MQSTFVHTWVSHTEYASQYTEYFKKFTLAKSVIHYHGIEVKINSPHRTALSEGVVIFCLPLYTWWIMNLPVDLFDKYYNAV